MDFKKPRVAMLQDGARLRYLVPLALQHAGILERAYIDWLVRPGSVEELIARLTRRLRPGVAQRMGERRCDELDMNSVVRNARLALWLRVNMKRFKDVEDAYIWAGRQSAKWVARAGYGNANAAYGFIRNAAPEFYRTARRLGLRTAGDQMIAPLEVEFAEYERQTKCWPGWGLVENRPIHAEYLRWERDTWEFLDRITCASDYVRDSLVSVGMARERITVIPYPWLSDNIALARGERRQGPLIVGFVGAVGLRKGAPYFLEVAKRFDSRRVRFVMVGAINLNRDKLQAYRDQVEFVGHVAHSAINGWLERFDVFFFPTTCEGSAGAVLEAMASGLPIITTPNSGSSVRHGIEGFVYNYDEVEQFTEAIHELEGNRDVLRRMGTAARERALSYQLPDYEANLKSFFSCLVGADN